MTDGADRAKQVIVASSAIATLYTGILAFAYSVSGDNGTVRLLPERGIWSVVFLGLAVVLALVKLAFVTKPTDVTSFQDRSGRPRDDAQAQVFEFIKWTRDAALRRRWAVQAAVVSLAVALVLLPLAFLNVSNDWGRGLAAVGLCTVVVVPLIVRTREGT